MVNPIYKSTDGQFYFVEDYSVVSELVNVRKRQFNKDGSTQIEEIVIGAFPDPSWILTDLLDIEAAIVDPTGQFYINP